MFTAYQPVLCTDVHIAGTSKYLPQAFRDLKNYLPMLILQNDPVALKGIFFRHQYLLTNHFHYGAYCEILKNLYRNQVKSYGKSCRWKKYVDIVFETSKLTP